jgi:DnaK suppressor protein
VIGVEIRRSILDINARTHRRHVMDDEKAAAALRAEKTRIRELLRDTDEAGDSDRVGASEIGDWDDPQASLNLEEVDTAVAESLQARLGAIERAEQRLQNGTYGRSVRSGAVIPDERLEADPAADLTADEALEADLAVDDPFEDEL